MTHTPERMDRKIYEITEHWFKERAVMTELPKAGYFKEGDLPTIAKEPKIERAEGRSMFYRETASEISPIEALKKYGFWKVYELVGLKQIIISYLSEQRAKLQRILKK